MTWKSKIIEFTEFPAARAAKMDSTFFPPVSDEEIRAWDSKNEVVLPEEWCSFYRVSNGMEAQKGEAQPVLALEECEVLPVGCERSQPWLEFGRTQTHRYYVVLSDSPSVYRVEMFGSDEEFYARGLLEYLRNLFRGQ